MYRIALASCPNCKRTSDIYLSRYQGVRERMAILLLLSTREVPPLRATPLSSVLCADSPSTEHLKLDEGKPAGRGSMGQTPLRLGHGHGKHDG
jgi:hypothetical protein